MEKIRSKDGTLIAYERSGEGPPLGAGAWHTCLARALGQHIRVLAKHYTVYAIDRRGRGESGDTKPYALEREFEDVAAVVDSIGPRVSVLGHSYGALCVLEASLLTANMRAIVAYEPPPAPVPQGLMERIQASLDAGDREEAVITFVRELVRMPPHEIEKWRASPIFPTRLAAVHTIPREFHAVEEVYRFEPERFKNMDVPTLMLLGGDSPAFAHRNVEDWHKALPDSRIVVMPGQQHIAMDTAPELFVQAVTDFLNEQD